MSEGEGIVVGREQGLIAIINLKLATVFGFNKFNDMLRSEFWFKNGFSRSVKVNIFALSSIGGLDFLFVNWFQYLRLVNRFDLFFVEMRNNFLFVEWF